MIKTPDSVKQYRAAKDRFFRPALINFFACEFPHLFGPIMREKLADELLNLFATISPEVKRVKPGQILWNALDKNTRGDSPNRRFVPVVLSIITEPDVDQLAQGVSITVVAKNAIARMIREAYNQGGILSTRDVGLLTLRRPSNVSRMRIEYENEHSCFLPHTGVLHDMGPSISHKTAIIRKVVKEKKDPADVARECNHTQRAVDRYLKDYHRVQTAYEHNHDIDYVHTVTGIAKHVVKQYIGILEHV